MAQRKASPTPNGRASPEAIEKRRAARQLNTLFSGRRGPNKLDGRTAHRRVRLLLELKEGRHGRSLKALEVLSHANQLLALGETISSIRKNGVKAPKTDIELDTKLVLRIQAAYAFRPEAWRLLGVREPSPAPHPPKNTKKTKQHGS
jgi:hypothetical protein